MFKTNKSTCIYTVLARTFTMLVVILLWALVSPVTAFFWTLFLLAVTFRLDSQMFGIGALILLILIPITQLKEEWSPASEQLAVYVFYLLCIVVVLQLLEIKRKPDTTREPSLVSEPELRTDPEPKSMQNAKRIKRTALVAEEIKRTPERSISHGKILKDKKTKMIDISYKHPNSDAAFKTRYHVDD